MSKKMGLKENFRVVVYPRSLGNLGAVRVSDRFLYGDGAEAEKRIEREYLDRCEEIAAAVKRHADNVGSVAVEFDQPAVCEHCGYNWTEASPDYNGGCCEKDQVTEDDRLDAEALAMTFPELEAAAEAAQALSINADPTP